MTKQNKFINAEIPVSNKHEAELAAKRAEELGYEFISHREYSDKCNYLTMYYNGRYGFYVDRDLTLKIIALSEFLNQPRTETITLDNGEKWRVELIEKVQEEPMSAEEFFYSQEGVGNAPHWMERYAKYRLEFERNKLPPQ